MAAAMAAGAALRAAVREEAPAWLQAARTMVAMLLALAIAFRLDLSSPSSAAVTVAVISLPQSGMVLEKSFYRLLATLAGALVTLLLIAVFAQLRDLFIVAVALWIGACAALSARFRNFQSYGWALAGYTTCLIGFPAYEHADRVFEIVVDRVGIVGLGILCGGVVNATVFPRTSTTTLVQSVRKSFVDFTAFIGSSLSGYRSALELRATQQRFLNDIVALESVRSASFFEDPETRLRTPRLRRFISQFMVASTTAHVMNRMRDDLRARGFGNVVAALASLDERFMQALQTEDGAAPTMAAEAVVVVAQLEALLAVWDELAIAATASLDDGAADARVELATALPMLREFVVEARDLAATYAELRTPRSAFDRLAGSAPINRVDPLTALMSGARAALALIVVCVFWIDSAWPDGFSAALLAAVACTLFVNAPAPSRSVWQMVRGFCLGLVAAFSCFTFVLPALDGLLLLVAGLVPFLMIGTYLMAKPETAGIGSGYCMMFLVSIGLAETMQYDIVALINGGLAQIVGVVVAAVAFTVLLPTQSDWIQRRSARTLWRELLVARDFLPLPEARHRFDSGARDLALQYLNLAPAPADRGRRLAQSMTLLEAGRALIALREWLQDAPQFQTEVAARIEAAVRAFTSDDPLPELDRELAQIDALIVRVETCVEAEAPHASTLRGLLQLLRLAAIERSAQLRAPDVEEFAHAA